MNKEDILISKNKLLAELHSARYYNGGQRVKRTFEDAVDIVLKTKETDKEWICVKDKKPFSSGDYMCIVKFFLIQENGIPVDPGIRVVAPCTFIGGGLAKDDIWTYYGKTERALVTHWMPFPKVPNDLQSYEYRPLMPSDIKEIFKELGIYDKVKNILPCQEDLSEKE